MVSHRNMVSLQMVSPQSGVTRGGPLSPKATPRLQPQVPELIDLLTGYLYGVALMLHF